MVLGLTASGLGAADSVLRTALFRAIAGAAGLAALLALFTGLAVARRITRALALAVGLDPHSHTPGISDGRRTGRHRPSMSNCIIHLARHLCNGPISCRLSGQLAGSIGTVE